VNGRAIFYGDRMTDSMKRCIDETGRRRQLQTEFNVAHGITPRGVTKSVDEVRFSTRVADARVEKDVTGDARRVAESGSTYSAEQLADMIERLEREMKSAAAELDFENAARLRDEVFELRARQDGLKPRRDAFAGIRASR
jgi:excinuclease ABC subunit B